MDDLFNRGRGEGQANSLATGRWAHPGKVRQLAENPKRPFFYKKRGSVWLGVTADDPKVNVGWCDDRHLVTVAGSRAGKGQSVIIPNLMLYPGSVVCIDPKGENARETASARAREDRQGQTVYVLDPFRVSGVDERFHAYFNPLDAIGVDAVDAVEQVAVLAESMVVAGDAKDAHWDESARAWIEALILHVLSWSFSEKSLRTVRRLLMNGDVEGAAREAAAADRARKARPRFEMPTGEADADAPEEDDSALPVDPFDHLYRTMRQNHAFDGVISGQANALISLAAEERGSVLSTARRNTKFLDGKSMGRVLARPGTRLAFDELKTHVHGISIYICLPTRYMATHARWLRMIIGAMMVAVERNAVPPRCGHPVLAILDEFPVLGHMQIIESAVGYMAGYGLKMWSILQDLGQLRRHYPASWETFMGNAGLRQFFGNTDATTLAYISQELGETEVAPSVVTVTENDLVSTAQMTDESRRAIEQRKSTLQKIITKDEDYEQRTRQTGRTTSTVHQPTKTALLTPDEVARAFRREERNQLVLCAGLPPLRLKRVNQHELQDAESYWSELYRRPLADA